jgi:hypothetical protein
MKTAAKKCQFIWDPENGKAIRIPETFPGDEQAKCVYMPKLYLALGLVEIINKHLKSIKNNLIWRLSHKYLYIFSELILIKKQSKAIPVTGLGGL